MAHGGPDGVLMVQAVVTVELEPIVPDVLSEVAAGGIGRYSGTDQDYQDVEVWTVTALKVGELKEIILISNDFPHTEFKVTIGSVVYCEHTIVRNIIPLVFGDLKLAAASVIKVEARSTDGTSITVDAVITGKEIG